MRGLCQGRTGVAGPLRSPQWGIIRLPTVPPISPTIAFLRAPWRRRAGGGSADVLNAGISVTRVLKGLDRSAKESPFLCHNYLVEMISSRSDRRRLDGCPNQANLATFAETSVAPTAVSNSPVNASRTRHQK